MQNSIITYVYRMVLFSLTFFSSALYAAGAADSCDCPKISCNTECEAQTDMTFYSEKCDGGNRVKSCSKPTCVKLENAPASCGFAKTDSGAVPAAATKNQAARDIASEAAASGSTVGRFKFTEGVVRKVIHAAKKVEITVGDEVHERDRFETDESGKAQILFNNGNVLNITPSSEVIITEVSDPAAQSQDKKRMVLDLLKGRIRNQVKQKYDGEQAYYRVRSGAAVAGVRGTDFVVSFVDDQKEIAAKIETMEGRVELSDQALKEKVSVTQGEAATYAADRASVLGALSDRGLSSEAKVSGHFTPIVKLTAAQIEALNQETDYSMLIAANKRKRNPGGYAAGEAICAKPVGALNQCAWSCENNPAGEKNCRTDLPNVTCVRRMCDANGAWSQPTRLPATYREACDGDKIVVKSCDY